MEIDIAVVPVAGLGTRLLPATKSQPKEMLPIGRKPVVQYVVEEYGHIFEEYKRKKMEESMTEKVKKDILDELYAPNGLLYKEGMKEVWSECKTIDVSL